MAITSPEGLPFTETDYEAIGEERLAESAQIFESETTLSSELSVEDIRNEVEQIYAIPTQEVPSAPATESRVVEPIAPTVESGEKPKFKLREATPADIDAIVDVDMRSFDSVYKDYGQSQEELRQELREKFLGRLEKVGSYWMPVLERDGEIVGFMTCCPTSKRPEDFESWEKTTDNGTLETTYDPQGKNLYVVTLSVVPEGSAGKDMLYADQIGKLLSKGIETAFFESRLPGLRKWVMDEKCHGSEEAFAGLTEEQQDKYAYEYFGLKTTVRGKEVRKDRLIRLYERIGCRCERVVANAYQDEPSMNFGVVCVYDGKKLFDGSDIPVKIPENRATRWMFGKMLQLAAHSPKLTRKLFS